MTAKNNHAIVEAEGGIGTQKAVGELHAIASRVEDGTSAYFGQLNRTTSGPSGEVV